MKRLFDLLERAGDRINPIVVKEVRQTLRGRYFRVSFWLTLCAASAISLGALVFRADPEDVRQVLGTGFYVPSITCLLIATHGLVPFSAFVAMGAEWDENTYDLLVLSNLRPRQIVLGKVFAAGIQALLYYSAFVPFLVFAFLLRGVDLLVLLATLGGSMVASFTLACVAVALSSLSRARLSRVLLMVLLGSFLAIVPTGQGIVVATAVMRFPGMLHTPEGAQAFAAMVSCMIAAAILFVLVGSARLAHPEENRSTGLRIYALVFTAFGLAWVGYIKLRFDNGLHSDENLGFTLAAQTFLAFAALFFATEPESLGKRVRHQVPKRGALALLAAPFLPGGGRGLIWYVLANVLVFGWTLGMEKLAMNADPSYQGLTPDELRVPFVATCFGIAFLGLPALVTASRSADLRIRAVTRISALFLFFGTLFLPALIGFFIGKDAWTQFRHPFHPLPVIIELVDPRPGPSMLSTWFGEIAATFVLVASLPRLYQCLREVLIESRKRTPRPAAVSLEAAQAGDA